MVETVVYILDVTFLGRLILGARGPRGARVQERSLLP